MSPRRPFRLPQPHSLHLPLSYPPESAKFRGCFALFAPLYPLCLHADTNCPFCNPFVLINMRIAGGGYRGSHFPFRSANIREDPRPTIFRIFYKATIRRGIVVLSVAKDLSTPVPTIFRTLFQVPYALSPLFATLTKTAGVGVHSSQIGTPYGAAPPPFSIFTQRLQIPLAVSSELSAASFFPPSASQPCLPVYHLSHSISTGNTSRVRSDSQGDFRE